VAVGVVVADGEDLFGVVSDHGVAWVDVFQAVGAASCFTAGGLVHMPLPLGLGEVVYRVQDLGEHHDLFCAVGFLSVVSLVDYPLLELFPVVVWVGLAVRVFAGAHTVPLSGSLVHSLLYASSQWLV
jgi:hypothetical protein